MRQRICGVLVLAVVVGVFATPVWAGRSLQVTMPFEFEAADQTFPKGRCKIELSSSTKVSVQCSGTRAVVGARTLEFVGDAWKATNVKEMTLKRYGDRYFLSEIWIATEGRQLLESEAEKALMEEGVAGQPVKLKVK